MSQYFDNKDLYIGPKFSQHDSHMIISDVHKPSQIRHLTIDSRFRDDYNDQFSMDFNFTIHERINEVKSIQITNVELPISFFNISQSLENNSFKITWNLGEKIIVIPDSQYDQTSFIAAINTQLSSNNINDLTVSIINHKLVFTSSSAFTYQIFFDVNNTGDFQKLHFKSRLGWLMGFRQQNISILPSSQISSTALVNLRGPQYLFIVIDEFNSRSNRNTLARLSLDPTNYPFGSILPANKGNGYLESEVRQYIGNNDLLKFHISIKDEFGRNINLNGHDISFSICIHYQ